MRTPHCKQATHEVPLSIQDARPDLNFLKLRNTREAVDEITAEGRAISSKPKAFPTIFSPRLPLASLLRGSLASARTGGPARAASSNLQELNREYAQYKAALIRNNASRNLRRCCSLPSLTLLALTNWITDATRGRILHLVRLGYTRRGY